MTDKRQRTGKVRGRLAAASLYLFLTSSLFFGPHWPEEASAAVPRAEGFWSRDVWSDPARPFLFYGEGEKDRDSAARGKRLENAPEPEALAIFPSDGLDAAREGAPLTREEEARGLAELKALKSTAALRETLERRLDAAVIDPTPRAIGLYLQANAFVMQKAGVFAESWRRALVANPQFDWTAVRPAVNAVSASLNSEREGRLLREVKLLASEHGFIFFGDDSVKTRHMLGQVREFCEENNFEVAYVAVGAGRALMPQAREDNGLSRIVARGVAQFPALVLVSRREPDLGRARLVATGAADAATLARNTHAAALELAREREAISAISAQTEGRR